MGDEANTTGVDTEAAVDTGAEDASTETVLTGDTGTDEGTETDSDVGENSSADDTAAADDKSDDSEAGKEGSDTLPDTYADFTMPEGQQLDEAALTEAIPVFKEMKLDQEQSQKAVDLYAKLIQASSQKQNDDFNQLMTDWRTTAKSDKEYGGDAFDESVKTGQLALNKYGTPELKQLLEEQGVGNHPEVIRFMVRVGKTLVEDKPGVAGNAHSQAGDRITRMYPESKSGT